ncbi:MAG: hypothetical protein VX325_03720 [Bacteroidota bacterium]|nr:hypothetical protein [Bacteroidota bacterium]
MSTTRGTSNVPLIMGIVGAVLSIPNTLCAVCGGAIAGGMAGGMAGMAEDGVINPDELGAVGDAAAAAAEAGAMNAMYIAIGASLLALIAGILGKSKPTFAGIGMLVAAGLLMFQTLASFNILAFSIAVLYVIGGIIAFTQKKEVVQ